MRRASVAGSSSRIIVFALVLCLCVIGVGYSAWTSAIAVTGNFSTGSLNIEFDPDSPYHAYILDTNTRSSGNLFFTADIGCRFSDDYKSAQLTLSEALLTEQLAKTGRFLVLQYPLIPGASGSFTAVESFDADLSVDSSETVSLIPYSVQLLAGGVSYSLEEGFDDLLVEISCQVYRQVETIDGNIIGTMFLKFTPESINDLTSYLELEFSAGVLPLEMEEIIILTEDDKTRGYIDNAQLLVDYYFSLPLFLEQAK